MIIVIASVLLIYKVTKVDAAESVPTIPLDPALSDCWQRLHKRVLALSTRLIAS